MLGKNDANYVVAIDGFIKREWLLRSLGCICKRKFTNDTNLIKNLKRVIDMGNVAVIYPEARYSLVWYHRRFAAFSWETGEVSECTGGYTHLPRASCQFAILGHLP